MKIKAYKKMSGQIECVTGLHIGGSADQIEIGGVDLPIIKHPITGEPYIPGSSLKGKMRSQLEKRNPDERILLMDQLIARENDKKKKDRLVKLKDQIEKGEPCGCGNKECYICIVFGPHKNTEHSLGTTRIIVRDSFLSDASRNEYKKMMQEKGTPYIEKKVENTVNRKTGTAKDPRSQERIPSGTKFDFEIVLQIYENDDEKKIVNFVKEGLKDVQQTYLGGFGSRGSGQVKFTALKLDDKDFTI